MRQAGYLAAAGSYALQNNIVRLAEDHAHARQLENALSNKDFVGAILPVETNIVIFEVRDKYTSGTFVQQLQQNNILAYAISPTQVRMVVHLDVSSEMINKTIEIINQL